MAMELVYLQAERSGHSVTTLKALILPKMSIMYDNFFTETWCRNTVKLKSTVTVTVTKKTCCSRTAKNINTKKQTMSLASKF